MQGYVFSILSPSGDKKYKFLKQERTETDDFAIKKYLVVKEKYFQNFNISLCICMYMSLHNLSFQNIPSIFYSFPKKTYIVLADKGFAPPPLTDMSAKNGIFF